MCQGFIHFSGFLHNFVLAKLASSSIRVEYCVYKPSDGCAVHISSFHQHSVPTKPLTVSNLTPCPSLSLSLLNSVAALRLPATSLSGTRHHQSSFQFHTRSSIFCNIYPIFPRANVNLLTLLDKQGLGYQWAGPNFFHDMLLIIEGLIMEWQGFG